MPFYLFHMFQIAYCNKIVYCYFKHVWWQMIMIISSYFIICWQLFCFHLLKSFFKLYCEQREGFSQQNSFSCSNSGVKVTGLWKVECYTQKVTLSTNYRDPFYSLRTLLNQFFPNMYASVQVHQVVSICLLELHEATLYGYRKIKPKLDNIYCI